MCSDRQTESKNLFAERECETAHLNFRTFLSSLLSACMCSLSQFCACLSCARNKQLHIHRAVDFDVYVKEKETKKEREREREKENVDVDVDASGNVSLCCVCQ